MYKLTIKEAAELLGVSTKTLRRWESEGKLQSERTSGGHRRYDIVQLLGIEHGKRKTIGYARVANSDQKADLKRQILTLEAYCTKHGWDFEVIQEIGSGMNYRKRGLVRLIKLICTQQVERLVLTHKDHLLRFGAELIFTVCETFDTEVIIINKSAYCTLEEDLTTDVLDIINVFLARLYGSRSQKNQQIVERFQQVAKNLDV